MYEYPKQCIKPRTCYSRSCIVKVYQHLVRTVFAASLHSTSMHTKAHLLVPHAYNHHKPAAKAAIYIHTPPLRSISDTRTGFCRALYTLCHSCTFGRRACWLPLATTHHPASTAAGLRSLLDVTIWTLPGLRTRYRLDNHGAALHQAQASCSRSSQGVTGRS